MQIISKSDCSRSKYNFMYVNPLIFTLPSFIPDVYHYCSSGLPYLYFRLDPWCLILCFLHPLITPLANISIPLSGGSSLVYLHTVVGEHPWPVPTDMMLAHSHSAGEEGVGLAVGVEVVYGCPAEIVGDLQSPGDAANTSVRLGGMGWL